MSILHVGTGPGDFAHIQDALDAALNGDTIDIAAGTYREQVTVNGKDLTFHGAGDGAGGTIIESPNAAALVSCRSRTASISCVEISQEFLPYNFSAGADAW